MKVLFLLFATSVYGAKHGECIKVELPEEYSRVCTSYGIANFVSLEILPYNGEHGCCPIKLRYPKEKLKNTKSVDSKFCKHVTKCIPIYRKK